MSGGRSALADFFGATPDECESKILSWHRSSARRKHLDLNCFIMNEFKYLFACRHSACSQFRIMRLVCTSIETAETWLSNPDARYTSQFCHQQAPIVEVEKKALLFGLALCQIPSPKVMGRVSRPS